MKIDFWNISDDIGQKPFGKPAEKEILIDGEALPDDVIPTLSKVLPKSSSSDKKESQKRRPKTNKTKTTPVNRKQSRNSIIVIAIIALVILLGFNFDTVKLLLKFNNTNDNAKLTAIDSLRLIDSLEQAIGTTTLGDDAFNKLMPVSKSVNNLSDKVLDTTEQTLEKTKNQKKPIQSNSTPRLIHNQFTFVSDVLCNITNAQSLSLKLNKNSLNLSFKDLFNSDGLVTVLESSFEKYPKIKDHSSSISVKGDVAYKTIIISQKQQLHALVDVLDAFILTHEHNLTSIDIPILTDESAQRVTLIFNGTQVELCSMVDSWSMINANISLISMKIRGNKSQAKLTLVFEFRE